MKRIFALFLLVAGSLSAQEFRAVLREPAGPVDPAQGPHTVAAFDDGEVSLVVDPFQQQRDYFTGQHAMEQQFRLRSRYRLHEAVTAEWETSGGLRESSAVGVSPAHPAFEQSVVMAQRATVVWKLLDRLQLSATARESATQRDGVATTSTATGYNSELSYAIWKEAKLRTGLEREETYRFDESIVTQDVVHGGFEQKLEWVPITLAGRAARTLQDSESSSLLTTEQFELSGEWKPEARAGLSSGLQWQTLEGGLEPGQSVQGWFTQLALQPAEVFTLTLRTAAETLQISDAAGGRDRFNLTVGTNVKLAEAVTAGFSVRYPLVKEDPSVRPYFSISASAEF